MRPTTRIMLVVVLSLLVATGAAASCVESGCWLHDAADDVVSAVQVTSVARVLVVSLGVLGVVAFIVISSAWAFAPVLAGDAFREPSVVPLRV